MSINFPLQYTINLKWECIDEITIIWYFITDRDWEWWNHYLTGRQVLG